MTHTTDVADDQPAVTQALAETAAVGVGSLQNKKLSPDTVTDPPRDAAEFIGLTKEITGAGAAVEGRCSYL